MTAERHRTIRPADALMHYLDQLLHELPPQPAAPESPPASTPPEPPAASAPPTAIPTAAEADPPVTPVEPVHEPIHQSAQEPAPRAETAPPDRTPDPIPAAIQSGGAGKRRHSPFKSLLFDIDGMTLAAPLDALSSVVEREGKLTAMPGSPAHVLGVMPYQGRNVQVLDAAGLLAGTGRQPRAGGGRAYVVLLAGGQFGLACDAVHQLIQVQPDAVKWRRGTGGRRPWFAGVITEHMCALLDISELLSRLAGDLRA